MIADPFLHDPLPRIIIPATLLCAKVGKKKKRMKILRGLCARKGGMEKRGEERRRAEEEERR